MKRSLFGVKGPNYDDPAERAVYLDWLEDTRQDPERAVMAWAFRSSRKPAVDDTYQRIVWFRDHMQRFAPAAWYWVPLASDVFVRYGTQYPAYLPWVFNNYLGDFIRPTKHSAYLALQWAARAICETVSVDHFINTHLGDLPCAEEAPDRNRRAGLPDTLHGLPVVFYGQRRRHQPRR